MIDTGKSKQFYSLIVFFSLCVFMFAAAFFYPKWNMEGTEATISWDVMGYYFYLPSFFYDDISHLHNFQHILDTYHPVDGFGNAFQLPNGNYMMKYSIGMSLMYLPFFLIAHLWASMGGYPVDGFSHPYQVMIAFGSIFVAFAGLWFARKNLLHYFDDKITAIVLLILVLATNYLNYVSFVGPMTHNYLFTIYSIVVWLTIRWYEKPTQLKIFLIGFFCGLATITRPSEIIILIIPFLWGIDLRKGYSERRKFLIHYWQQVLLGAGAFILALLPQILYWKIVSDHWFYYSYQDQGFSFTHPHIWNGLTSFKNGWLIYTPVMILALIGFIFLYKKERTVFWAAFLFAIINIYIVYSWDIWWYGGSFGSRAMIQSYAILIFPMAAFFEWIRRKKIWNLVAAAGVLFFMWLNLIQTYQCHANGIFEAENMTSQYYWRIFGKTHIDPNDKKLLDTKEEMPKQYATNLKVIYEKKAEGKDSLVNGIPMDTLVLLRDDIEFSKVFTIPIDGNEAWYRVSAKAYFPDKEWNVWQMTQFIISLSSKGKNVRTNLIRIQRITDQGYWRDVFVDIQCTPDLHADSLKISFWNAESHKKIFIDDLKVEKQQ